MEKRKYNRQRSSRSQIRRMDRYHTINALLKEGKTQSDISRIFGISRQAINQIINRHKVNAREKLNYDLKHGFIVKPKLCGVCGKKDELEAHHDDYGLYDKVDWLCKQCHMDKHYRC